MTEEYQTEYHTIVRNLASPESPLEPTQILSELRRLVKEVKLTDPTLQQAKLCDLSFQESEQGLDVKMYFAPN